MLVSKGGCRRYEQPRRWFDEFIQVGEGNDLRT